MASAGQPPLPPDDAAHPPRVPSNATQHPPGFPSSSSGAPPPHPGYSNSNAAEAAPPLPTGEAPLPDFLRGSAQRPAEPPLPDFLRGSAQPPAEPPLPDFLRGSGVDAQNGGSGGAGPSEPPEQIPPTPEEEEALLKAFFQDVKETDRDNEVNRILGAFKLNPFEQLGLRFDASLEDCRRQYRKVSLLVHPDKCNHPLAKDAFEVLGAANKSLLDEEKSNHLRYALNYARDQVREERKKSTKRDAVVRLAALVHESGREGIEKAWENSDEFHELWKMKARDILGRNAYRSMKLTKRLKSEEEKLEVEEAETRKKLKVEREHRKNWEESREVRVGTWRDFVGKKGKKGVSMMGGLKPPKLKEEDTEKTYIQRPVGEQFRPPPPKGASKRPQQ